MRSRPILLIAAVVMALAAGAGAYLLVQSSAGGQEKERLLDVVNRKRAAGGLPTFASEVELTWTATRPPEDPYSPTPAPTTTPAVPSCAQGTISGAAEIVAQYGGSNGTCAAVGRFLFFEVSGWYDTPLVDNQGGIAVYACSEEDPCLPDQPLATPGAWTFYPAPAEGKFKVQGFLPPDALIILGMGQICFSLTTGRYGVPCPIRTFPPAPPSPPELPPTSAGS